jgi:hypothetical protein
MRNLWLFISAAILIVVALAGLMVFSNPRHHGIYRKASYSSAGERIYYAGVGSDGRFIPFTGGPHWLATIAERGCVNCHGIDGRGGYTLMMTSVVAPDITYTALTSGEHEHSYQEGESHGEEETSYTDETIGRAIAQGIDLSGRELSIVMPRWKMTDEDMNELLAYLKKL